MTQKSTLKSLLFVILLVGAGVAYYLYTSSQHPSQKSEETHTLLKKMPINTLSFYSWRSDDAAYRNLQLKSALQSSNSFLNELGKLPFDPSQERLLSTILEAIGTSGLISEDPAVADGMSEFLGFLQQNSPLPHAGMYLTARDTVDLKVLVEKIKTALEDEKVSVTQTMEGDKVRLVITEEPITIYALFTAHQGAMTTSPELTQRLFENDTPQNGYDALKSDEHYQHVMSLHDAVGSRFGIGFANFAALSKLAQGAMPQETAPDLNEAPIGMISLGQYAGDALTTEILAELVPNNEQQKLLINNISRSASNTLLDRLPDASAVFFILDGQLLRTIQEGAVSDLTAEEKTAFQPALDNLAKVKGIGIGALPAGRDALVPDIYFTFQADDPAALLAFVKDQTKDLISTQIPMANWLEKDINGTKVHYILTPLGFGLYLASVKDVFVATSTETAMTAVIGSAQNGSTTAKLFPATASVISPSTPLVSGYLDFKKIADAVESVQGSMAMFTGGASALNAEEIQNLKRMGSATFGVGVSKELVRLRWDLTPSK